MKVFVFTFVLFTSIQNNIGQLVLNDNGYIVLDDAVHLVVEKSSSDAIQTLGTGGNIVSEAYDNVVDWKISTSTGNYTIPFTTVNNVKIPLSYQITSAAQGTGEHLFSTYQTTNNNNPLPPSTDTLDGCLTDNSLYTIDRFWRIESQDYQQLPSGILNFGYDILEIGGANTIQESQLQAERFNPIAGSWEIPEHLYGTANTSLKAVEGVSVQLSDFYPIWTLVDSFSVTYPELESNFIDTTVCYGSPLTLLLSGADTYEWNTTGINAGLTLFPEDSVSYTVIGSNANTCKDTLELFVNVSSTPTASFSVLTPSLCLNECVEINNNSFSSTGESLLNMNLFFNNTVQDVQIGVNEICDLSVGNYEVGISVEDINGCKDSLFLNNQLEVYDLPTADFSISPEFILDGEEVLLTNESQDFVDVFYELDNGNQVIGENASYIYNGFGLDTVIQIVIDQNNCSDTAYQIINIKENENLYIPNAFTPDANGLNESFKPIYTGSLGFKEYRLLIFNRWGEQVYSTNNIEDGWDGTYKGKLVKQGAYVYKINYLLNGRFAEKVGHVFVLK